MKKRILGVILAAAMILSLLAALPLTVSADDNTFDVSADPVIITTDADMAAFQAAVNAGNSFSGKTIKLAGDVALSGRIGTTSSKPFSGNFDGQGHTVTITQTLSNPDGNGGLFDFIRVPENGTLTLQNVHVTGIITCNNTEGDKGYTGAVVSTVDAGKTGNGGTFNMTGVRSSVRMNLNNNRWKAIGGMIGFIRHEGGVKPLTVNVDSCIWDGVINSGPALLYAGGFLGWTGKNNNGSRTLTINITNSVAAGRIQMNIDWNQTVGLLIGCATGSESSAAVNKVTVNISSVISIGVMTNSVDYGSSSNVGHIGLIDGTTELNMTNLYYKAFDRKNLEGNALALANGTAHTSTGVAAKTDAEFAALTASDFTDSAKWAFKAADATNAYIPCPVAVAPAEGWIVALTTDTPAEPTTSEEPATSEEPTTSAEPAATEATPTEQTTTEAPAPATDAPTTTKTKAKKKGCGSTVGAATAIVLVTAIFGGAVAFRKKEN